MIPFGEYYRKYLGLDSSTAESGGSVFASERRAKSVAYFYIHHLISTVLDEKQIHSISPILANAFGNAIRENHNTKIDSELCREIDDVFFNLLAALSYSTRIMRRMTLDNFDFSQKNEKFDVTNVTASFKRLFDKQSVKRGKKFAEFMWNERLETINAGRYFAIIENDEIISSSFISDIDNRAGNIVVSTQTKYRKKGYGRAVVIKATEWCIQNDIRPIYLVDENNIASIRLAEGLGFQKKAQEIVVSTYKKFAFNR